MAKKNYGKLILFIGVAVVLFICTLYLKSIGEKGNAFLLFLWVVYFVVKISRLLRDWHFYQELCRELEYIGKDPAHQAVKIYRLQGVKLWVKYAPEEKKELFKACFSKMSEQDFGYGELKYIVEQINKQ